MRSNHARTACSRAGRYNRPDIRRRFGLLIADKRKSQEMKTIKRPSVTVLKEMIKVQDLPVNLRENGPLCVC